MAHSPDASRDLDRKTMTGTGRSALGPVERGVRAMVVLTALCTAIISSSGPVSAVSTPRAAHPLSATSALQQPAAVTTLHIDANGGSLNGAHLNGPVRVVVDAVDATEVTWLIDGTYLGKTSRAPFTSTFTLAPGEHRIDVRVELPGSKERWRSTVIAGPAAGVEPSPHPVSSSSSSTPQPATTASALPHTTATPTPTSSVTSRPTASPTALPGTPIGTGAWPLAVAPAPLRRVAVRDTAGLRRALADARAGDLITLADGVYTGSPQFEASADGTLAAPITLRGSRGAVLTTGSTSNGGYGLHVTGDRWRLEGFTVSTAKKGVVLDGSLGTLLDGLDVGTIGQEAVHFRSASSYGVIRRSSIHDTGLRSPEFGEGVYVGSANSNWGTYSGGLPDRSDAVLVESNSISRTSAEGVDVKEGTTGGVIRDNKFLNSGTSGENSADSWIDLKGNGWFVTGNTGSGTLLDAVQTHVVATGWGQDNTITGTRVDGPLAGAVVRITPEPGTHGNVVRCDNSRLVPGLLSNVTCTT